MDGAPLRLVTFRVSHDCPVARLSREVPGADLSCWSGHRLEVIEVRCTPGQWARVEDAAGRFLRPERTLPTPEGGLVLWEPRVDPARSISRTLEAHDMVWLQPMRVRGGWEHYDAISFGPAGEAGALAALSRSNDTQVVRRRTIGPQDVLASLFLSLRPALEAPTDRQAEALVAAAQQGYYASPRGATTAEVAQGLGIGRSAFEERLRGGENRLFAAILPALEQYRRQAAEPPNGRARSRRRGLPARR
jgi:hypothetical protein